MITDYDDTQRYMDKAVPTGDAYAAQITYKGSVMATLCGRDAETLKTRAHNYAAAMNWRRAVVAVTNKG